MHADVQPAVFAQVTGRKTIQLAVNGGLSYLVLENLAHDSSFKGTVICELWEYEIVTGKTNDAERRMVDYYDKRTPAERSEIFLQRFTQELLALPNLQQIGRPIFRNTHYYIGPDRTLFIDFSSVDLEKLRPHDATVDLYEMPVLSTEEFLTRAHKFERLAAEIEKRGGRVIFVNLPLSGLNRDSMERTYPKASYWDVFARQTEFRTIDFRDCPELEMECPDYTHLDMRDAPAFTRALAEIVLKKGLLQE
jgi:hypothetical protein